MNAWLAILLGLWISSCAGDVPSVFDGPLQLLQQESACWDDKAKPPDFGPCLRPATSEHCFAVNCTPIGSCVSWGLGQCQHCDEFCVRGTLKVNPDRPGG